MPTSFETFITTELPVRPTLLLYSAANVSYDGNPGAGAGLSTPILVGAPTGTLYMTSTGVMYTKLSGGWSGLGSGSYLPLSGGTLTGALTLSTGILNSSVTDGSGTKILTLNSTNTISLGKLVSITNNGTEKVWFDNNGGMHGNIFYGTSASSGFVSSDDGAGTRLGYGSVEVRVSGGGAAIYGGSLTLASPVYGPSVVGWTGVGGSSTTLSLYSGLGVGSSDIAVKVGSSVGGTTGNAKLLSVVKGLGGSETERFYVGHDGSMVLNADASLGTGYANPVLRIPITATNAFNMIQLGGTTSTTWELAIGYYTASLAPVISTRGNGLLLSMPSGTTMSPVTPGVNDLGSGGNYWRSLYLSTSIVGVSTSTPLTVSSAVTTGGVGVAVVTDTTSTFASTEKLLSIRNNTAEQCYITGNGSMVLCPIGNNYYRLQVYGGSGAAGALSVQGPANAALIAGTLDYVGSTYKVVAEGRVDQAGTDSSGTPGAATINKPTGISAIAAGATSVVITNSLAVTTLRIHFSWLGDHGAARSWITRGTGSFTMNLSAAATADTAFSWEISSLL